MKFKRISTAMLAICFMIICGLFDALAYDDTVVMTVGYDDFEEYRRCVGILNNTENTDNTFSMFSVKEESDFDLCRLILSTGYDVDFYGAKYVIKGYDGMQIMQYDTAEETEYAYSKYKNSEYVDYVEPDRMLTVGIENQELNILSKDGYNSWGFSDDYIGMSDFFRTYLLGKELPRVVVAVIDTGIDSDHEMFEGRLTAGYNYIAPQRYPEDDNSHGTHVAGIICDGTYDNVKIMPLKALGSGGSGSLLNITSAIRDAAYNGADIINLSFGGMGDYDNESALSKAISYAADMGTVILTAAGNEAHNIQSVYPAYDTRTIAVANIGRDYQRYTSSNYGERIDLAAPGVSITSAANGGGYKQLTGTSMACPHVSACAAALLSYDSTLKREDIKTLLKSNAQQLSDSENYRLGAGMVKMSDFSFDAVMLDKKELKMCEGASIKLNADAYQSQGVSWLSENDDIVTVADDGTVSAVSAGETYVCAASGGGIAGCLVTVVGIGDWYKNGGAEYEIETANELLELSYIVNSGLDDFNGKTVTLNNDINMTNIGWIPIGYKSYTDDTEFKFSGKFNGGGYTISNLTSDTFKLYQGLFGIIGSDGSAENVSLKNVKILSEQNAGAVAGRNDGRIYNCAAYGTVTLGRAYIVKEGGIAGENNGSLSGCAFNGNLLANGTKSDTSVIYCGGIAGENNGAIINCSAEGTFPAAILGVSLYKGDAAAKNTAMLIDVEDVKAGDKTLVSLMDNSKNGKASAAIYDADGELMYVRGICNETILIPKDRAYIKFFLWNDMTPLCPAAVY